MVSAADEFSLCCEEKDPNCPDTCVCVCVCLCVCVCVCVFVEARTLAGSLSLVLKRVYGKTRTWNAATYLA